jgi:hypothetical protein
MLNSIVTCSVTINVYEVFLMCWYYTGKKITNKFKGLMQQVSVQAVTKNAN